MSRRRMGWVAVAVVALAAPSARAGAAQEAPGPWLLVVSGVSGDDDHRTAFAGLSTDLIDAAIERWHVPENHVRYLAERVEVAPERVHDRSTSENLAAAFEWLAAGSRPGDPVLIVLIGHGSAQGGASRFNLPGPDVGPEELAPLLDTLADRRVALVNTTASSAGFLALAAPGRTIVTATRGPREQQETLFPRHFVDAFAGEAADTDKDGRLSVLEAFVYATTEVARVYESEGRIRTEHALLDDDGDGDGSETPGEDPDEGGMARWVTFGGGATTPEGAEDPELARMLAEIEELQAQLDDLRAREESMEEEEFLDRLEMLLVEIAELDARIRERRGEGT